MKFSAVQDIVDFIAEDIKYTISEKEYDNFEAKDRITDFQQVKISIISLKNTLIAIVFTIIIFSVSIFLFPFTIFAILTLSFSLTAFQSLDLIPEGYTLPSDRVKPLGTAQAILAAKPYVSDKFIIINADDFYGSDAFKVAADFLRSSNDPNTYANVAYRVTNTMTENGSVKRGVLVFDENKKLNSLIESKIEKVNNDIIATPLEGGDVMNISSDTLVSMNMFCFNKNIMDYIEEGFKPFMEANKNNLASCEYLIPTVVSDLIHDNKISVDILATKAVWYGITYKEDKDNVVKSLENLMNKGEYPEGIWK